MDTRVKISWTAENIKSFRNDFLLMTQKMFSDYLSKRPAGKPAQKGTTRSSVAMWESGRSTPNQRVKRMLDMVAERSGFKLKEETK